MKRLKAILADDEESARDVLENLLVRFCPEVELIAKCENVLQAVEAIKLNTPDIVFLDIEMPNYAGYEIVNFFSEVNFKIIFVTAYDYYAIKAFEIAALDYLLKPVSIERLKSAVDRAKEQKNKDANEQLTVLSDTLRNKEIKNIIVSDKGQQHIVPLDKIIAIEAQESYSTLYTAEKKYIASKNLKHFEKLLAENKNFFRSHKSWIIDLRSIKNFNRSAGEISLSQNIVAKLSKYRLDEFEEALKA